MNTNANVRPGPFGGHIVDFVEGAKTYSLVVIGAHVSGVCEYATKPADWRCGSAFVTVRRNLQDGPTLSRLTAKALLAINAR